MLSRALLLALAGGLFSHAAVAQWQWVDKDGRKVFSDRAPPVDIPEKNVLKRPGTALGRTTEASTGQSAQLPSASGSSASTASSAVRPASAPLLSGKDPQLEQRKKQAEEAELAKKKADEDKLAQGKADNCARAVKAMGELKSGIRIATTNARGEREILDENARAAESQRIQSIMNTDCK